MLACTGLISRQRLLVAVATVAGLIAASIAGLMAASIAVPMPLATAQPALPTPSTQLSYCNGSITSTLSEESVRVCDPVTVTAVITPVCAGCGGGLNVIFANILWVTYGKWMQMENETALDLMETWQGHGLRVKGAVLEIEPWGLAPTISRKVELTEDLVDVRQNLGSNDNLAGGYQCWGYHLAVREGIDMLEQDRRDSGLAPCEAFVNYACVPPPTGPNGEWLRDAQKMALQRGAGFFVGCPFGRRIVTQDFCPGVADIVPRNSFFEYPERGRLRKMIEGYDGQLATDNGQNLYLSQRLPPGLTYVAGSASVPPTTVSIVAGETVLSWAWLTPEEVVPQQVIYEVRPAQEGEWPISGDGLIVDKQRHNRLFSMQPVTVTVAGLCETPTPPVTPTATLAPTPTTSATPIRLTPPTPTGTPLPSSTPSATATRRPAPAILPLALREQCVPGQKRVDVALVIDASTSMTEIAGRGTKLDAARAAARAFLDQVHLDAGDQAAIVAFNADVSVLAELTSDRAALLEALDRLEVAPQTRIHLGVRAAQAVLTSARHRAENAAAMVVLTDGRANPESPELAVDAAEVAKAVGITVFTIGLGAELDFLALGRMASTPGYFFQTLDAGELEEIYTQIAVAIPCSGERFWGRR
jgi:Mg-chelatase subunit ChlD